MTPRPEIAAVEIDMPIDELRSMFRVPVVLVTHDAAEAATLADSIVVYFDGSVIQSGSVAAVFDNPSDGRVKRLLSGQEDARSALCALHQPGL